MVPGPTEAKQESFFEDATKEYGLSEVVATHFFVVDLNFDKVDDLVVLPQFYSHPEFYIFDKKKKKFIKSKKKFFNTDVKASYFLFYDFNKDGVKDVVSGVLNQKNELTKDPLRFFRGFEREGKLFFEEEKRAVKFKPGATTTVMPIDYNLDGNLDLFVGNYFGQFKGAPFPERDVILKLQKNQFIPDEKALKGESKKDPDGSIFVNAKPTYAAAICDVDRNGFPDILTASTNGHANKLWLNFADINSSDHYFKNYGPQTGFSFDLEGALTKNGGGRTFAVSCVDYNFDGMMDIFVGELYHNYDADTVDRSSILTGTSLKFPPSFFRTEYILDSDDIEWHQADRKGVWFDYNNDGLLDLLVDNSGYPPHSRLILFQQMPDHSFMSITKQSGLDIINPVHSTLIDVDMNGKQDILVGQNNIRNAKIKPRIYLFKNKIKSDAKIYKFFLKGVNSNTEGIGAKIVAKIARNDKVLNKTFTIQLSEGGLPSQHQEGLHLAINSDEKLRRLKVVWPYLIKKNGQQKMLEVKYRLPNQKKSYQEYTLCESGRVFIGKENCF